MKAILKLVWGTTHLTNIGLVWWIQVQLSVGLIAFLYAELLSAQYTGTGVDFKWYMYIEINGLRDAWKLDGMWILSPDTHAA